MIGKVFVKNKVNFLYGESGLGKTISTIKALNEENICPILFDLDDNLNPETMGIEAIHVDGERFLRHLHQYDSLKEGDRNEKDKVSVPDDSVIIVDTYKKLEPWIKKFKDDFSTDIVELLNARHRNCTLIIIGHNVDIATKKDIPDAPSEFVNHCASKLFLSMVKYTDMIDKKKIVSSEPTLKILKLRNYDGDRSIRNWMR